MTDRLVIVDVETTGLEVSSDLVLEVGVGIYSVSDLSLIDSWSTPVWESPLYDKKYQDMIRSSKDDYVLQMHTKSGLWDACRAEGATLEEAEAGFVDFLKGHGIHEGVPMGEREPMVGSSVQFDRMMLAEHMPQVEAAFSYRNIDISTLKELCRRYNKPVYEHLDSSTTKRGLHRVDPDIEDTAGELGFYVDNFLWTAE
jgi:oligoribonuclease